MNRYEVLLDEQRFPYENMTLEERNCYLNIIRNCKDICDSENKVDGVNNCKLVELHLKKKLNKVSFNVSLINKEKIGVLKESYFYKIKILL